jgi:glutamate synthase domain-containing protein 2
MAAAMGGDEYGFGSVAMIATGCVMARICHTNNCPVGVASQVSNDAFSDFNFWNAYGSVIRNCWCC